MLTLEEIRGRLFDRRLRMIAAKVGVHYQTILKIRDRDEANPTYETVKKLSDYLEEEK